VGRRGVLSRLANWIRRVGCERERRRELRRRRRASSRGGRALVSATVPKGPGRASGRGRRRPESPGRRALAVRAQADPTWDCRAVAAGRGDEGLELGGIGGPDGRARGAGRPSCVRRQTAAVYRRAVARVASGRASEGQARPRDVISARSGTEELRVRGPKCKIGAPRLRARAAWMRVAAFRGGDSCEVTCRRKTPRASETTAPCAVARGGYRSLRSTSGPVAGAAPLRRAPSAGDDANSNLRRSSRATGLGSTRTGARPARRRRNLRGPGADGPARSADGYSGADGRRGRHRCHDDLGRRERGDVEDGVALRPRHLAASRSARPCLRDLAPARRGAASRSAEM